MLQLKGIIKEYPAGNGKVEALRGIDLEFRESEFVSILGPSGCGKTTMLNIVGGLDQYTEGDLVINGKSTKNFNDRDWDTYRNHSIGFVFQSYNLIPHQSVLQNVELALTLSGVSKSERRARALEVLDRVGLSEQIYKRPSEMSGGQMQRVAIARALVNNPDIILADEPTGALDTETSLQVMEILKEIASDRLVIMVTHNPDLAERYSTRIIKMLDGKIIDDSMPYKSETTEEKKTNGRVKKPSMSMKTSFSLSLKNLFTKKGRTILTAFAGSIGIIGIALIYALSEGFTTYIDQVQEDTLSSYPLTVEEEIMDLSGLMQTFMGVTLEESDHELDGIYVKPALYNIVNSFNNVQSEKNDLASFKKYIEEEKNAPDGKLYNALSGIQYGYDIELPVYTENREGDIIFSDSESLLQELMLKYMKIDFSSMISAQEELEASGSAMSVFSPMSGGVRLWQEILSGKNGQPVNPMVAEQYDIIYGSLPNSFDEIILIVDENNELDDITLYALGLTEEEQIGNIIASASDGRDIKKNDSKWNYKEICSKEYRVVLPSECYQLDEESGLYVDLRESETGRRFLYSNALPLKVVGIVRPNETSESHMLTSGIGYTSLLTEYVIENTKNAPAVKAQIDNPAKDILSGKPFKDSSSTTADDKKNELLAFIDGLSVYERAEVYLEIMSVPDEAFVNSKVEGALGVMSRADIEAAMLDAITTEMHMNKEDVEEYLASMSDADLDRMMTGAIAERVRAEYAAGVRANLEAMPPEQLAMGLTAMTEGFTLDDFSRYYELVMDFSESTYEKNMKKLGVVDLDSPSRINLFASSFENKDIIEEVIAEYNEKVSEIAKIKYVDYIGLMMSSITTIINTITYVLIAFVAISLIVSSIMIGVITLISVQERTKEIGILRAIGASKRDVSLMFNAETILIGMCAGLLGVGVTYILCIPINAIIHALTGITNLNAYLPIPVALILTLISVILTLFSGIIPSRSAAKKDPVVALRTE